MKTTLKGLQALQIALRNRVERLPDGSVAIKIKNDFTAVTLGDIATFCASSDSMVRFAGSGLDYCLHFKGMSRNQAKRLRKRLQEWVDSAIALHQFEQGIQAAAQAGAKAGENLHPMFAGILKNPPTSPLYGIMQKSCIPVDEPFASAWMGIYADTMPNILEDAGREKEKQLLEAIRKDREAGKFDGGNRMAQLIAEQKANEAAKDERIQQLEKDLQDRIRKHVGLSHEYAELHTEHENLQAVSWAKEAAKDKQIEQLKADLEAANLAKDGLYKYAKRIDKLINEERSERIKIAKESNELERKYLCADAALDKALITINTLSRKSDNLKALYDELNERHKERGSNLSKVIRERDALKATNAKITQLSEALANMTRLRDEAVAKSVRLPKAGEEIEYRNSESAPWKTCTVAIRPHGRPYAPDTFGLMYLEAENHGILWRWPQPKERTAEDAKAGDRIWHAINGTVIFHNIDKVADGRIWYNGNHHLQFKHFGALWGFAE